MNRQYRMVNRSEKEKAPFPSPAFILAILIMAMVAFGFYRFANHLITRSDMFRLRQIKVVGNRYLETSLIKRLSGVEPGVLLFRVPLDSVTRRILKNPYFAGVSVSRSLPSTLIISVQEREPVAYLVDHRIYMVDRAGKILLKKPKMSVENLPLITGLSVRQLLKNRKPLLKALDLIDKIREVDEGLFQFISEIHMNVKRAPNLYLIRGGARVDLSPEMTYKEIYLLSEFIRNSPVLNQLDKIKKIDLTFKDRIVVTRKS